MKSTKTIPRSNAIGVALRDPGGKLKAEIKTALTAGKPLTLQAAGSDKLKAEIETALTAGKPLTLQAAGSDTPTAPEYLPCPWCGGQPTVTQHHRLKLWGLIHRCIVTGPISFDFQPLENIAKTWNTRAPHA